MDLASAVQFLIAYEASLKLAPGQKPPPPSPSLFSQLSDAIRVIETEVLTKDPRTRFSGLPPSIWSDWPLCCGLDLTQKELQAARSLPPVLLRERGLLSLFLAFHSSAEAGVIRAGRLAPLVLVTLAWLKTSRTSEEDDPAPFPSAHLAVRVGHRLINADDTLEFEVEKYANSESTVWKNCALVPIATLGKADSNRTQGSVPHEAAGLSLAKETAVMLDALSAAQRPLEGGGSKRGRGLSNRLPILEGCRFINWSETILNKREGTIVGQTLRSDVYREVAELPAYNPVLLLEAFYRDRDSVLEREIPSLSSEKLTALLETTLHLLWKPLSHRCLFSKLGPADAYAVMRLGLEDLGRKKPCEDTWATFLIGFAIDSLHSGLLQPEVILRARPQLLEWLVEGLARQHFRPTKLSNATLLRASFQMETIDAILVLLSLLTRSPAVGFHLRKFFTRSGCLQVVQETQALTPTDCRQKLIRLLGPRAAQSDIKTPSGVQDVISFLNVARRDIRRTKGDVDPWSPASICDFIVFDLTLDMLREPQYSQPILQYLSELAKEIAATKRPHVPYGALMVVGLGKACLVLSKIVATALTDIREAGLKGKSSRGPGGAGASRAGIGQQGWRARLVDMGRQMSLLRRRVLHELLPLAETREAALWEGVTEEEVVAALMGDA